MAEQGKSAIGRMRSPKARRSRLAWRFGGLKRKFWKDSGTLRITIKITIKRRI
jgi:hypothetical protein